jgi:hypothetical protein
MYVNTKQEKLINFYLIWPGARKRDVSALCVEG